MGKIQDIYLKKESDIAVLLHENDQQKASNEEFPQLNGTCEWCDSPLLRKHRDKKFCSNTCFWSARYRKQQLAKVGIPESPKCLLGSFQSYQKSYRKTFDVIITDPPYGREYLSLYKDLATFALETLRPGGWLLCLTGWGEIWEIGDIFRATALEYITICTYLMPGATLKAEKRTSTGLRSFQQQAKPLLWYQKRGGKLDRRRAGTSDLIKEKQGPAIRGKKQLNREDFHWQQDLEAFKQLVFNFSNPQDALCDPCMGSGTTLVAAYAVNRPRIVGIEKAPDTYRQAVARIAAVVQEEKIV